MGGARNSQCRSVPYPFQQLTCVQHVHWLCGRNSKCARVGRYFQFFQSPSAMSTTLTRLALAPLWLHAAPALAAKVTSYQKRHRSYSCAPPQPNPTVNGEVGVCMTTLSFTFQYFFYSCRSPLDCHILAHAFCSGICKRKTFCAFTTYPHLCLAPANAVDLA